MNRAAPYEHWVAWIVRNRGGGGPVHGPVDRAGNRRFMSDTGRVAGWMVVRMVADNFEKRPREVAADVIAFDDLHENGEEHE